MFKNYIAELKRELTELSKYKFNLIFSNMGIFFMLYFFVGHLFSDNKEVVYLMLIIWYFAIRGLEGSTYLLESEITDRTIINIIQSKTSIFSVLIQRNLVSFTIDSIKAIPIFIIIFFMADVNIAKINYIGLTALLIALSVYIIYSLGVIFASFTFKYKRLRSFVSLGYLYMLFFGGVSAKVDNQILVSVNKFIFPFENVRILFTQFQNNNIRYDLIVFLVIQAVICSLIAKFVFDYNLKSSLKRGGLYGI